LTAEGNFTKTLPYFFLFSLFISSCQIVSPSSGFNAERALQDVKTQVSFGPRTPDSPAHQKEISYISDQLSKNHWSVEISNDQYQNHLIQNITGKRGTGSPWIILGAHYDSRLIADQDQDPSKRTSPVPGANDGASGVAVLLELSRSIPQDLQKQVWLVFFDAEDQGDIPGWNWILGSQDYANHLPSNKPQAFILVDMIGDKDLNIYYEINSNPGLSQQIFEIAAQKGFSKQFIQQQKYQMIDDHIPFIQKGIPSVDLIDFDYPYWHTSQDNLDKVSAESLNAIGQTLSTWLEKTNAP
jgi:glutaminyl-peptide cyclotransferase